MKAEDDRRALLRLFSNVRVRSLGGNLLIILEGLLRFRQSSLDALLRGLAQSCVGVTPDDALEVVLWVISVWLDGF